MQKNTIVSVTQRSNHLLNKRQPEDEYTDFDVLKFTHRKKASPQNLGKKLKCNFSLEPQTDKIHIFNNICERALDVSFL